ncbi:tRNA modification GTPase MnmE OS=Rickettsia bellii (strain OSU 85-389) GN=mnmE PE=3 SV=1 [Rhizoctonia solani AG-1 IB]|uniref:tRNA modification GTPase MnmE n=1 Tax=Thanatephorus cucumeris (strain AG1-IB / isolate 7/3/14) TaxID=1108050 RepID=A0A0B7FTW6_THACB|nr:tRNA modification GTPase MnmE OS=Rickettsia bellii (strain OSU 85-389) GN=mnmE PE=3 SV=1 [Rhizoctonia solani AG-1 IB]
MQRRLKSLGMIKAQLARKILKSNTVSAARSFQKSTFPAIFDTGSSERSSSTGLLNRPSIAHYHSHLARPQDHGLIPSPAERDTIFALSSPPGKGAVAVIRISGTRSRELYFKLLRPTTAPAHEYGIQPWKLKRCRLVDPGTEEILDDALAVFFRSPRSFTTEDSLELHMHSSRAVISAVLRVLSVQPGCRLAEPGEFTRRALLAGRIDLTQAEGLADLINAETEVQRKGAMRVAEGNSRRRFESIRNEIIRCRTLAEAIIDFGEGEEIEDGVWAQLIEQTTSLVTLIRSHLDDNRRGEILRSGVKLAIFGAPNAGKSSLLNYLAARPAAIVTPIAGTTRDVLEVSLDIGGVPVRVSDTAGLRRLLDRGSDSNTVEQIGIERAKQAVKEADVRLCVVSIEDLSSVGIDGEVATLLTPDTAILFNKVDKAGPEDLERCRLIFPNHRVWVGSVIKDTGMVTFVEGIANLLKEKFESGNSDEEPLITHARHRTHLEAAVKYLEASLAYGPDGLVFAAEELRYASQELGKVTGDIGIEDVLDVLFSKFCIGK